MFKSCLPVIMSIWLLNPSSNLLLSIPPQSWRWSIPMLDFQSCPIVVVTRSKLWKVTNLEYSMKSCRSFNDVIAKPFYILKWTFRWCSKRFFLHGSARSFLAFGLIQNNVLLVRIRKVDWWFIFIKNNVTKNSLFTCRVLEFLVSCRNSGRGFPATSDRLRSTWYIILSLFNV